MSRKGVMYQEVEASVQNDEVEGDGSVVVAAPLDQHVQGLAWGGMSAHWKV